MSYYISWELGWLNVWILTWSLVIIQFIYMFIFREGGRRAVDTSWYNSRDRLFSKLSSLFQMIILVVSLFIPLKLGSVYFYVGLGIYLASFIFFILSFHAYGKADLDKIVEGGIYRYSRNPMYFSFHIGMLAACVAGASLILLGIFIFFIIFTHMIILGEERYCEERYGESYREYKRRVSRYFLFF